MNNKKEKEELTVKDVIHYKKYSSYMKKKTGIRRGRKLFDMARVTVNLPKRYHEVAKEICEERKLSFSYAMKELVFKFIENYQDKVELSPIAKKKVDFILKTAYN